MKRYTTYNEEDYKSGDGMLTTVWGTSIWHFLHTMSFNYPNEPTKYEKKHYRDFILNLENVLPCKYCRINLKKNFKKLPLTINDMKNRYMFSKYIYDLHEHINTMLNKKSGLSYNDVRERYEHFRARCTKKPIIKVEKGCTESLYGEKSKCVINIIPRNNRSNSFKMDPKCVIKKGKK